MIRAGLSRMRLMFLLQLNHVGYLILRKIFCCCNGWWMQSKSAKSCTEEITRMKENFCKMSRVENLTFTKRKNADDKDEVAMLRNSFMAEIVKQYKERYLCVSKQFDNFFFKLLWHEWRRAGFPLLQKAARNSSWHRYWLSLISHCGLTIITETMLRSVLYFAAIETSIITKCGWPQRRHNRPSRSNHFRRFQNGAL